ncbi:MAG TPA: hypothetical protein VEX15_02025 [Nocardioidaceae bacterium]|nr:hypothetical protein [Nocardioidaceae bacterium]
MTRVLLRAVAAAAAAFPLVLGSVVPAAAESTAVRDRGDEGGRMDIWTVKLSHGPRSVATKVRVRDFRRGQQQEIFVLYDVRPGRRSLEYAARIYLVESPRLQLYKVRADGTPDHTIRCRDRVTVNYRRDVLRYVVPRTCLRRPNQVRINMMSARKPDELIKDYAPAEGKYTQWVSRT